MRALTLYKRITNSCKAYTRLRDCYCTISNVMHDRLQLVMRADFLRVTVRNDCAVRCVIAIWVGIGTRFLTHLIYWPWFIRQSGRVTIQASIKPGLECCYFHGAARVNHCIGVYPFILLCPCVALGNWSEDQVLAAIQCYLLSPLQHFLFLLICSDHTRLCHVLQICINYIGRN